MHIRSTIRLDFFERLKVLFGRVIVLDTHITTDEPFTRANHNAHAFIETKTKLEHWKNKPDLVFKEVEVKD